MNRVILSGSAGSGKSSLLRELGKTLNVCEELSREVIIEQQRAGTDVSPWGDVEKYGEIVLSRMVAQYERQSSTVCVYDRGVPDLIAWLRVRGRHVDKCYDEAVRKYLVGSRVFYAPMWQEIYCMDEQRPEAFSEQVAMEDCLRSVYGELGFELILLPKQSVQKRCEFVLTNLEK